LLNNFGKIFVDFVFSSDFFKENKKKKIYKEIKDNDIKTSGIINILYNEKEKEDVKYNNNNNNNYNNDNNYRLDLRKLKMVIFLFTNDSIILQDNNNNDNCNYNDKVFHLSNLY
jgi:hypothetical protein